MTESITALYDSSARVTNMVNLSSTGIPNEKVRSQDDRPRARVILRKSVEPEIEKIRQRHHPLDRRTAKSAA